MEAPTLKLGPLEEQLVCPRPSHITACMIGAKDDQETNLAKQVACLEMCWPRSSWPAATRPTWRIGLSIVEHGAAVFDALVMAGIAPTRIWKVAPVAYTWAQGTLPKEEEVKAAEDFSGAPTGG